jgi:hypothetical protein
MLQPHLHQKLLQRWAINSTDVAIEKILQDHSKQDYTIYPGNHRHEQRLLQAAAKCGKLRENR